MEVNELVSRVKKGDEQAFGLIYDLFAQRIFKYIRYKIQNRSEAEDILQEVFIKVYKGVGSLDESELNFSAWVYKIASNTINDHFRKHYRMPEVVEIDENFDAPGAGSLQNEIEKKSDVETVRGTFDQLPDIYKQVLELRYLQDLSLEEVAKVTGKTNLAVRLIQYRALKKVKKIIEEDAEAAFE